MTSNNQLLDLALKYDQDALRILHHRFYEPLYRYILMKVGDTVCAEDIASDVFLRVLEALKKGRGWTNSPDGWIFGIARNVVADFYRLKARQPEQALMDDLVSSRTDEPAQRFLHNERLCSLFQALQKLTEEQRDVVLLRFMEGLSIAETALALKKRPGAIKSLQFRALQSLAALINGKQTKI